MTKKGVSRRDLFKLGGLLPTVPGLIKGIFESESEIRVDPEQEDFDSSACPITMYPPGWGSLNQDLSQGHAGSAMVFYGSLFPEDDE
jgi:hypothetical protein